jgi:hypothetical protein
MRDPRKDFLIDVTEKTVAAMRAGKPVNLAAFNLTEEELCTVETHLKMSRRLRSLFAESRSTADADEAWVRGLVAARFQEGQRSGR